MSIDPNPYSHIYQVDKGFSMWNPSVTALIHESVMLGNRLGLEGKIVVETRLWEGEHMQRHQWETNVNCRIRHRMKETT